MQRRDLLFSGAILLIMAAVGVIAFDQPAEAAGPEFAAVEPDPDPIEPDTPTSTPIEVAAPAAPIAAAAPQIRERKPVDPNRTDGTLVGNVIVSAEAAQTLKKFQIRIVEAVSNPLAFEREYGRRPFERTLPMDFDPLLSSPDFHVDAIPFSPYGYHVDAWIPDPGLNGTGQFVQVTKVDPDAGTTLGISSAPTVAIRLFDQSRAPVANEAVILVPQGLPLGRPTRRMDADGSGIARFDTLKRGTYAVKVGSAGRPRNKETQVQVQPSSGAQTFDVQVPIGHDLQITVRGPSWNTPEARIQAYRTDTTVWRPVEAQVDKAGRAVLEHLEPGEYLINITAPGHEVRTRTVRIRSNQAPPAMEIRLGLLTRR